MKCSTVNVSYRSRTQRTQKTITQNGGGSWGPFEPLVISFDITENNKIQKID